MAHYPKVLRTTPVMNTMIVGRTMGIRCLSMLMSEARKYSKKKLNIDHSRPRGIRTDIGEVQILYGVMSPLDSRCKLTCRASNEDNVSVPSSRSSRETRTESNESSGSSGSLTLKEEAQKSNAEVYDRLIDTFMSRPREDWRKLIAYSKQWPSLSNGVIDRMEKNASDAAEAGDEDRRRALRRAARQLKVISDEMKEFSDILTKFRSAPSRDWESMVTQYRASMGNEFFTFLELKIRVEIGMASNESEKSDQASNSSDFHRQEAEALAALATQLAALVEAHDRVAADDEALEAAADKFQDLLQCTSMEAAEAKIDELATSGKLDPALLLTMAKAYAGVKETDATQEEVKDIMAHLYFKAKESFARQAPPEARIIKFLISVDSPKDRDALLEQALTPGMDFSTENQDYLHTTPENLLYTIENILAVYDGSMEKGMASSIGTASMTGQAAALMNPEVIERLRQLAITVKKKYM